MTFDLVHFDTVQMKFVGRGHGSKFMVTGMEKWAELVVVIVLAFIRWRSSQSAGTEVGL